MALPFFSRSDGIWNNPLKTFIPIALGLLTLVSLVTQSSYSKPESAHPHDHSKPGSSREAAWLSPADYQHDAPSAQTHTSADFVSKPQPLPEWPDHTHAPNKTIALPHVPAAEESQESAPTTERSLTKAKGKAWEIPLSELAKQLNPKSLKHFKAFSKRFPQLNPIDINDFQQAVNTVRKTFSYPLRDVERNRYGQWLAQMTEMSRSLTHLRAQQLGHKIDYTDQHGRHHHLTSYQAGKPVYFHSTNLEAAESTGANLLNHQQVLDPLVSPSIRGDAFHVNVMDWGTSNADHVEFLTTAGESRVRIGNSYTTSTHATHVAGTIGAAGVYAKAKGMAPGLQMISWHNYALHQFHENARRRSHPAGDPKEAQRPIISNASLGYGAQLNYDSYARYADAMLFDYPYHLFFNSAGNDGSGPSMDTGIGQAKNVITVGAAAEIIRDDQGKRVSSYKLAPFSSRGGAQDGRIKPDIIANGVKILSCSVSGYAKKMGTSMSSPNAAGSAALVVDYFSQRFAGHIPRAATTKAILLHTADDVDLPGPDYNTGFGYLNVYKACEVIKKHADNSTASHIVTKDLDEGEQLTLSYQATRDSAIKVTLCWTDPAIEHSIRTGSNPTRSVLVNDLNIHIIGPDKAIHYPYVMPYTQGIKGGRPAFHKKLLEEPATNGINSRDTVEQISIPAPKPGHYQVVISHTGKWKFGSQNFSMIVEGMNATAADKPAGNTAPRISTIPNQTIREDTTSTAINFKINDAESPSSSLQIHAHASNTDILDTKGFQFYGVGRNRSVRLTPSKDAYGQTKVTLTVSDGQLSATQSFRLVVKPVNDPPVLETLPLITGSGIIGHTLSTDTGIWNDQKDKGSIRSYAYQWYSQAAVASEQRNDAQAPLPIPGATQATYTIRKTDSEAYLSVSVTATDTEGASHTAWAKAVGPIVAAPPNSTPVAWWEMNEQSWNGNRLAVRDSSGFKHHGRKLQNARTAPGLIQRSAVFDSKPDRLIVPHAERLTFSEDFTIALWAKFRNQDKDTMYFLSKGTGKWSSYSMGMLPDKRLFFQHGQKRIVATLDTDVSIPTWNHFAAVKRDNRVHLFVNGRLVMSKTVTTKLKANTSDLVIGSVFVGCLDDVRLYERGLSKTEILSLAQLDSHTPPSRPVDAKDSGFVWIDDSIPEQNPEATVLRKNISWTKKLPKAATGTKALVFDARDQSDPAYLYFSDSRDPIMLQQQGQWSMQVWQKVPATRIIVQFKADGRWNKSLYFWGSKAAIGPNAIRLGSLPKTRKKWLSLRVPYKRLNLNSATIEGLLIYAEGGYTAIDTVMFSHVQHPANN